MKKRDLNSALNWHCSVALSPLAMMPALFLIVHIVHKKDLIYHGMTPALH